MGPIHFLMYVYMSLLFSGLFFSSNKERKSRNKKEEEALAPTKHKIQFSMVCCSGTMEHHVHPNRLSRHMHKTNHAGLGHLLFISSIGRGGSFFEKEICKVFEMLFGSLLVTSSSQIKIFEYIGPKITELFQNNAPPTIEHDIAIACIFHGYISSHTFIQKSM